MGKKGKIKCLVCQQEFKKVAGDAQQCPACASLTTAPLRPVVAPDAPSAHEGGGLKRKHSEVSSRPTSQKPRTAGGAGDNGLPPRRLRRSKGSQPTPGFPFESP